MGVLGIICVVLLTAIAGLAVFGVLMIFRQVGGVEERSNNSIN